MGKLIVIKIKNYIIYIKLIVNDLRLISGIMQFLINSSSLIVNPEYLYFYNFTNKL